MMTLPQDVVRYDVVRLMESACRLRRRPRRAASAPAGDEHQRLTPAALAAASTRRLEVLVVTPGMSYPPSDGFSIRVYGLLRELAHRHQITMVRFDSEDGAACVAGLAAEGIEVRLVPRSRRGLASWRWLSILTTRSYRSRFFYESSMQTEIDSLLANRAFDIVQVESTELWAYDFGGVTRPPIVVDTHNVHRELLARIAVTQPTLARRVYWRFEAMKFAREERAFWRFADACVMTSARETAIARATPGVRLAATVPNGVDLETFRPIEDAPIATTDAARAEIVFTGLLSYRPNEDGVRWLIQEVMPRIQARHPGASLTVVGKEVPPALAGLASPNVTFTGWVNDVRPYLARANAVVVPLRAGSGTRLKIIEALAMGTGVVSTSVGCEGLDVASGRELLIADTPDAFADAVVKLIDDPDLARRLGKTGRELMERRHGWPASAAALEAVYVRILAQLGPGVKEPSSTGEPLR